MSAAEATTKSAMRAERKAEKREQRHKKSAIRYPFWFGGSASAMAACVTHPLDLGMSGIRSSSVKIIANMVPRAQSRYDQTLDS